MKTYITVSARAGGKSVVRVSIVDGTLSAKAEAQTYVGNITGAVKAAKKQALQIMEEIKEAEETA